jgi:hypothetical protein
MSAMEKAATRCILAARERELMARSRGAQGCCSHCREPKGDTRSGRIIGQILGERKPVSREFFLPAIGSWRGSDPRS